MFSKASKDGLDGPCDRQGPTNRRSNMMIAAVATIALAAGPSGGNMNADAPYRIANAAAANPNKSFGFRGRYFELESPMITSKYSQVFWRGLGVVPLPADVVKEYDGKIMAITGFEVDVLRNTSKGVERVPCYESYNPISRFHMKAHFENSNPAIHTTLTLATLTLSRTHTLSLTA